jgi:hypothetical protein
VAGGYGHFRSLLRRLYVGGSHLVNYHPDYGDLNCTTRRGVAARRPLNESATTVFPAHPLRGHLCFLIAHNDARTAALYVEKPGCNTASGDNDNRQTWVRFRLR